MRQFIAIAAFAFLASTLPGLAGQGGVRGTDVLPEKKAKEAKTETVRGTVQSVDNNRIKVSTGTTTVIAAQFDLRTSILVDGKKATITDLRRGQAVVGPLVHHEGSTTALTIAATSPKK